MPTESPTPGARMVGSSSFFASRKKMAVAGTMVSARSGRSWYASRRSLFDIAQSFLKSALAACTSMARPFAGQRSNSVSTFPPVPTSESTLPSLGSASPSARSMASSSSFSRLRSTVFTPLRYPSSMRTVPSERERVKAVLP
jgi:hypothetical protein